MSAVHLSAMRLRTTRERQCAFMTEACLARLGIGDFLIPSARHVQQGGLTNQPMGMRRNGTCLEFVLGKRTIIWQSPATARSPGTRESVISRLISAEFSLWAE